MIGGPYDGRYVDFDHEPLPEYKYKNMPNQQEEAKIRNGSWESQYATIEAKIPIPFASYRLIDALIRYTEKPGLTRQMKQLPIYIYQSMPPSIEKNIGHAIALAQNAEWETVGRFAEKPL